MLALPHSTTTLKLSLYHFNYHFSSPQHLSQPTKTQRDLQEHTSLAHTISSILPLQLPPSKIFAHAGYPIFFKTLQLSMKAKGGWGLERDTGFDTLCRILVFIAKKPPWPICGCKESVESFENNNQMRVSQGFVCVFPSLPHALASPHFVAT